MKSILEQIFTDKIESLGRLKVAGAPNYQDELDIFLKLVLKSSKDADELANVTKRLSNVVDALAYPASEDEAKSIRLYQHLTETTMKTYLVKAATAMHRAATNNKVFDVYRMMFVQAEILYSYLDPIFDLKKWAEHENIFKQIHNEQVKKTGQGIVLSTYTISIYTGVGPGSKPYIMNDFFSKIIGTEIIASSTITVIKRMRDYASHGQHEDEVKKMRNTIGDTTANLELYLTKWSGFLNQITHFFQPII